MKFPMGAFFLSVHLVSLLVGMFLLVLKKPLAKVAKPRGDESAVQASHVGNPLRIGGVAVLFATVLAAAFGGLPSNGAPEALLLLSSVPVVLAGLAEDFGYHVSPRGRLVAAFVSAALAVYLLGAWAPRADLPGLDWVMAVPVIAILVTLIFSAGFCHAVNLIDGMNGLAVAVVTTSALGFAAVGEFAAQPDLAAFAILLAAATSGFLLLNWPRARMFLGDAGAYGLGHLLIWLAILLVWRSEAVAVPAMLLILFWPLADLSHTITRRAIVRVSILQPDRMHLHQKVRRMLDIIWFGYRGRFRSNPMTTLIMLPFIALPVISGVLFWNRPWAAWVALGVLLLAFAGAHLCITPLARRFRRSSAGAWSESTGAGDGPPLKMQKRVGAGLREKRAR